LSRNYHIITMGCQMNEYDSDYLGQVLMGLGYTPTDNPKNADLILINTCTVRIKAEQKAVSALGRMVSLKKKKPDLILGLLGCLAQQEGSNLMKRFPELDLVLGTRAVRRFKKNLERIQRRNEKIIDTDMGLEQIHSPLASNGYFKGRVKGYISVMEGCNNFCSYCVVPYVRGREISRSPEKILKEAEQLVSQGVKEITLLGQNVNSYHYYEKKELNFPSLLRSLNMLDGLARIRFTTSHPKDLSDELIFCFGELDNLCPHIHLPFQSGSDKILKLMNRGYTQKRYKELIKKLRKVRPNMAITSDVMVGFPQESDEDFQMTLDLIQEIEFDNLFSFKYSDRKGTLAAKMTGKVDEKVKTSRLAVLQQLQKYITLIKNKRLEGSELVVLVEGHSKKGRQLTGRTNTNKIVNFNSNYKLLNQLVNVKIKQSFINSLCGELIV